MKELILEAWSNRELLKDSKYSDAVRAVIEEVDKGRLRVASPSDKGWQVNEWVKQAILMYFGIQQMQTWDIAPFEFYDKMLLKKNYKELGVRAVPHAVARYGAYLAKNVVLMPSYVNIGAYVDEGTMVDTWATVGSCAQIGKGVHLSGGVGIGGVLEPLQASPVIIEDGCFIGSFSHHYITFPGHGSIFECKQLKLRDINRKVFFTGFPGRQPAAPFHIHHDLFHSFGQWRTHFF